MMRTSQPGWNDGAIALSASRSRRRTRFRTTAPPRRRPVDRPKRVVSRSVRTNRAENKGWDLVVPAPWIAAKSCGRESITSRGVDVPRPVVRLSAASDREPAERRGYGDPLSSSCGRGSRVPWRDGASWAGRSASSFGPVRDPLHPTSGTVTPTSPRGTQTRRHPAGRMARRRPADDMACVEGVSNGSGSPAGEVPTDGRPGPRCADGTMPDHGRERLARHPARIPPGSMRDLPCDALRAGAILSGPSAPETFAGDFCSLGSWPRGASHPARRRDVGRRFATPDLDLGPQPSHIPNPSERRSHRTNGREASLASRPGRAPGIPVARELRDVVARHAARGRRRAAVPDRRPQRLRQGLARDPLPLIDQPDPRPHRRLQRPGRVHHRCRAGRRRGGRDDRGRGRHHGRLAGLRVTVDQPARPGRADPGRWRGRGHEPQPALHLRQLHRRLGQPPGPRGQPVGRRATRAMPTTRCSCTAGWDSARPT